MTRRITGRAAAAAVALAAAVGLAAPGAAAARGGPAGPLEGVWQMDGYGLVVTVSGGHLTSYDVTAHSCVPGWIVADRDAGSAPGPDGAVRFVEGDHALTLTPQGPNRLIDHEEGSVGTKTLDRIGALPPLCTRPAPNDPLAVFDRFAEDFAENYPFFAAKGIDWARECARARQGIGPATTPDQLQQVLIGLLEKMGDAHISLGRITDRPHGVYFGRRPDTVPPTDAELARFRQAVSAQLVGPERSFGDERLTVGQLPDGLRYLRVDGFGGYAPGFFSEQAKELDRALDALLADPDGTTGLVIDVRANGGGSDELGLRIASRLTDRPYVAYRKAARNDPADPTRYTRPQPIAVRPSAGAHFTGPVALLTSPESMSAAETFTQALIGRSPRVVRIGQNTQGVFSDVLVKALSPDFLVGLPNEKFLTRDGSTFDGPGIPPHVRVPVFAPADLAALRDPALSTARRLLAEDTAEAGAAAAATDTGEAADTGEATDAGNEQG
ncbi:S41 family peptidase [Kitasatospora sp. NPDC018619]|uniref:S41 family peptidase n=1 Tax=unclassified Kitasatospora TaxID=2633591 RepID=UPI0037A3FD21